MFQTTRLCSLTRYRFSSFLSNVGVNGCHWHLLDSTIKVAADLNFFCRVFRRRKFLSSSVVSKNESCTFTINTPEFYSIFTPELKKLVSIFQHYGYELRIVGGAVRDLLCGIAPLDVDFATTATPEQMYVIFEKENVRILHKKGEKHGTVAARINDKQNFEITTLRTDVSTDGRHAVVEFTTDWKKDAARRDLTINSMYLGLDGKLYDFFNGYEDLKNRRVIFVGDAKARIEEDYLRILRYFRFFGRIVKDPNIHDEYTLNAIRLTASGLQRISGERIWSEFSRILSGNFVLEIVQTMLHVGLGPYMGIGDVDDLDMPCFIRFCDLSKKHAFKPISFLAALLKNDDQVLHFHSRVRLSSYERDLAFFFVHYKSKKSFESSMILLREFQRLIVVSKNQHIREYIIELFKFWDDTELLTQFLSWQLPKFPVTRKMLIQKGMKDPHNVQNVLERMKILWMNSDYQLTAESLLNQIPDILSEIKQK